MRNKKANLMPAPTGDIACIIGMGRGHCLQYGQMRKPKWTRRDRNPQQPISMLSVVIAGLVPAIHALHGTVSANVGVDARDKRGHDEGEID
jgi:hypothetical protein